MKRSSLFFLSVHSNEAVLHMVDCFIANSTEYISLEISIKFHLYSRGFRLFFFLFARNLPTTFTHNVNLFSLISTCNKKLPDFMERDRNSQLFLFYHGFISKKIPVHYN